MLPSSGERREVWSRNAVVRHSALPLVSIIQLIKQVVSANADRQAVKNSGCALGWMKQHWLLLYSTHQHAQLSWAYGFECVLLYDAANMNAPHKNSGCRFIRFEGINTPQAQRVAVFEKPMVSARLRRSLS